MTRRVHIAVSVVTGIVVLYCGMILLEAPMPWIQTVFFGFPVLMIWLVYTVLKHGRYEGDELQKEEEWGYEDRDRSDLGMF